MRLPLHLLIACALWLQADSFQPSDVAILGDIDYSQKSAELECAAKPPFCALVFNGRSGDKVEVTVTGGAGKPFVALADGTLQELARGTGSASATLPRVADDLATYYIVFQDPDGKPGRFTVQLRKQQ
jgi:hypothetical protein